METETGQNIEGTETRKKLVARREVSLADILEIKLGNRGSGRVRRVGMYLTEEDRDRRRT